MQRTERQSDDTAAFEVFNGRNTELLFYTFLYSTQKLIKNLKNVLPKRLSNFAPKICIPVNLKNNWIYSLFLVLVVVIVITMHCTSSRQFFSSSPLCKKGHKAHGQSRGCMHVLLRCLNKVLLLPLVGLALAFFAPGLPVGAISCNFRKFCNYLHVHWLTLKTCHSATASFSYVFGFDFEQNLFWDFFKTAT